MVWTSRERRADLVSTWCGRYMYMAGIVNIVAVMCHQINCVIFLPAAESSPDAKIYGQDRHEKFLSRMHSDVNETVSVIYRTEPEMEKNNKKETKIKNQSSEETVLCDGL